ncbi:RICIN domain-containing protein [Collinsella aerofaciens]|uniref:RICIN domain-containing protein n=1 Tax=Collinsella aerofaciens TaxID=74426 RepID=UPI0022AA2A35|nr:RICIN domain-containing protein [Collinsella aerofaciens]
MNRPLYYLLCAIACTSLISATLPTPAIAEAMQPPATAEQQAQADATSDTGKAEDGTNTNAATDTVEDSAATSIDTSAANTESADGTATANTANPTAATPGTTAAIDTAATAPTPTLRAQTNPTPAAISATSQTGYAHSATATQNGVIFTVSWNDAPAGTATTFHVTQTNGSSQAKARMDVPTYWDGGSQESVCDPSRPAWSGYCSLGTAGHDFTFDFTASGTYRIYFYFMDNDRNDPQNDKGIYYLRTTAEVTVNDAARPSVTQIVNDAVDLCRQETNGSEYDMALWLHDWTLDQLEYDHSLNWCSAESGLTRHQGTCESYQRIYSKLLDAAGIGNGRITGNGHTWNAVKIDGKWCQMDLTWDDTSDNWYGDLDQRHLYFGLTDELMAIAHSDHTANYQKDDYAYRSTDLSNNYFVRNGKAEKWAETYADRIQQHLDAKEESFSIDADNQSFPPSISGIQNGIIAYAMNLREWITADTKAALFAASVVAISPNGRWATSFLFKTTYLEPPARLEGEYRIALAMAPSMCVSAAASGSSLSRWGSGLSIEPDAGSGLYRIKAADGRALTAVGRAAALRSADGTDSQLWSLTETDGGYVVGSRSTGMVLDSRRAGTSEGNEVRLEWANGTGAQVWILFTR